MYDVLDDMQDVAYTVDVVADDGDSVDADAQIPDLVVCVSCVMANIVGVVVGKAMATLSSCHRDCLRFLALAITGIF